MDIIAEIRRRHLVSGESITAIARSLNLSRPTVRKHLRTTSPPTYQRQHQPAPKLTEAFQQVLAAWLTVEQALPKSQRRTAQRLFEGLQIEGYLGSYDGVCRFVKRWKAGNTRPLVTQAFVPLHFAPGEVCQFDWCQEQVDINGLSQKVKVAHFRLVHSRQIFVVAYPRETQEMLQHPLIPIADAQHIDRVPLPIMGPRISFGKTLRASRSTCTKSLAWLAMGDLPLPLAASDSTHRYRYRDTKQGTKLGTKTNKSKNI